MPFEVNDRSREALAEIRGLSSKRLRDLCEDMTENAKAAPGQGGAPRDTGNLASSIDWDADDEHMEFRVFTRTGNGTNTGYGGYVHVGTSKRAPNPFFQRAFDKSRKAILDNGGSMT